MIVTLNSPKVMVTVPQKTQTLSQLTIERVIDNPNAKIVRVFFKETQKPTILWEGTAYDNIGQWTDVNVQQRILEIFS